MRVSVRLSETLGRLTLDSIKRAGDRPRIFVDGVEQINVVLTADDEEGLVHRYVLDANGKRQIDPDDPGSALTEVVRGKIEIRIEPTPAKAARLHRLACAPANAAARLAAAEDKRARRRARNLKQAGVSR